MASSGSARASTPAVGRTDGPRVTGGVPGRPSLTSGPGGPGKAGFSSGGRDVGIFAQDGM
jgi:hypothetical protein